MFYRDSCFPKLGVLLGASHTNHYTFLGSTLGPPCLWRLPFSANNGSCRCYRGSMGSCAKYSHDPRTAGRQDSHGMRHLHDL